MDAAALIAQAGLAMSLRFCDWSRRRWTLTLLSSLLVPPVPAQDAALRPVRVVLVSSKIGIAGAQAFQFKLVRLDLQAGKTAQWSGENGFLYVLRGVCEVEAGSERRKLEENDALFIDAISAFAVRAVGAKPAVLLHYRLVPANAPDRFVYPASVMASELYSGNETIPGLSAGPHELSLTRVSSPVGAPPPPMHQRSGAALYYLLSGKGTLHMQGKDAAHSAGDVQFEPYGFVHTWENTGAVPLIFLQANISREGVPEILWQR